MAFEAGAIVSRLTLDSSKFRKSLQQSQKETKKFGNLVEKNGQKIKALSRGMAVAGAAIVGALVLMTKKASDFEEASAKFGTVFQDVTADANAAVKDLTKNYGLSTLAAKDMLSATGDLLIGLGLQSKEALTLSARTQKLAIDLASFTNFQGGAKGAADALTKAMTGERESVKALGIVITEEMVKEQLLKEGKEKLTGMALLQAKAEATLTIAVAQSKNAMGDYARTKGSLANVVRRLAGRMEDLWVVIGTKLIPVATDLAAKITKIVEKTVEWVEVHPKLTSVLTKSVAVLGGTLLALGGIGTALPKIIAGLKALRVVGSALISPLGLLTIAIVGIAISIQQMADNLNKAKKAMTDFGEEALVFKNAAENFKALWITVRKEGGEALEQFDELMKRFGGNWDMILKTIIADPKFATLKVLLLDIAKGVKKIDLEGKDLSITLPDSFTKAGEAIKKTIPAYDLWATTVAKIFHETSIRAAELRRAVRDIELKMPPIAVDLPKMSLEDFKKWYKQWLKDLQEKWVTAWQETMDLSRYFIEQLSEIFYQFSASRMQQIDNEYETRRTAIENSVLDEEAKAVALDALDKEMTAKRRKALRTQAIFQKAIALSTAIINIAEAVTKALTLGPFLGIAAATWVKALGAIQIAAILAAPIPSAEEGAYLPEPTLIEAGHGPLGEVVLPLDEAPGMGPRRIIIQNAITIGETTFRKETVKAVNKAGKLGDIIIPNKVVI